jgi:23S rRNA (uridine2552-2'-O)-methyltransferase
MSKLRDRRARHDPFHRRARERGYRARSVFKLQEIDDRVDLIPRGARVLDLGCAPGSWLQYASQKAGPGARLVGLDRGPVEMALPGTRLVVGDVRDIDPAELVGDLGAFDVVLSDMAPDTTGVRHVDQLRSEALFERALEIAEAVLAPGGNFVGKLFQGPAFQELVKRCRSEFDKMKIIKPKGSRSASIEQYLVGRGFRCRED